MMTFMGQQKSLTVQIPVSNKKIQHYPSLHTQNKGPTIRKYYDPKQTEI